MCSEPQEAELVLRFREGDARAGAELARKYVRVAAALVYAHLGPVSEAEDVVQDVFVEAQKSLRKLRDPHRFAPWFYTIAERVCNRWLREQRRAPLPLEEPESLPERPDPDTAEERGELRAAVDALPRPLREVVYLRYFDNLSYARMAALLGITPSAVNARLMKARRLLRARLGRTAGSRWERR